MKGTLLSTDGGTAQLALGSEGLSVSIASPSVVSVGRVPPLFLVYCSCVRISLQFLAFWLKENRLFRLFANFLSIETTRTATTPIIDNLYDNRYTLGSS